MSKKLIIAGIVIVGAIAALPLIGNMSVSKVMQNRMAMLEKNGVKVEQSDNGSSYLRTKSHFSFTLEDPAAFKTYIDSLSEAQVPAYLSAMLDDVVMGADVSYSNILVDSDVKIDLYPIAFTKEADTRMKMEDQTLHTQMLEMLKKREFMYHMDYDVAGESFDGYIKDIDRTISFKDGRSAKILFSSAKFEGEGTLVEPKNVTLKVKKANIDFSMPDDGKMMLSLSDFQSNSKFAAKNSFNLNYDAKQLHFKFKDPQSSMEIDAKDMKTLSDSKIVKGKMSTAINATMGSFSMHDQNGSLALEDFTFVMDAEDIDEAAYEAFQKASDQAGNSSQYTMLAAIGVVSKGFNLHVDELSVKKLSIKDSPMMDGFTHKVNITVKPDDQLVQKMQMSPMMLIQDIDIDAKLHFSSALYSYIKMQNANVAMADSLAKHEGDNVVFDITLKAGQLLVNGKTPGQ